MIRVEEPSRLHAYDPSLHHFRSNMENFMLARQVHFDFMLFLFRSFCANAKSSSRSPSARHIAEQSIPVIHCFLLRFIVIVASLRS